MKHLLLSLFVAVAFHSISIEDTRDFKKVLVSIHYDGRADDRILIDRDKMESDDLSELVKKIVRMRQSGQTPPNVLK